MSHKILSLFLIFILIFSGVSAGELIVSTFKINADDTHTADRNIEVYFTTYGETEPGSYCINDSNNISNCGEGTIIPSNNITTYLNLTGADGEKTLYVFVKDANVSSNTFTVSRSKSASIILDTTGPTITITAITDQNKYATSNLSATISASDPISGVNTLAYKFDSNDFNYINVAGATINATLTDGNHTLTVDTNDSLGNISSRTISFIVDTTTPVINSVTVGYASGYTYTKEDTPNLTFNVTELTPTKIYLSCLTNATSEQRYEVDYATTITNFNITSSTYGCNTTNGTKTYYAKLVDHFGNTSAEKSFTINFDNISPSNVTNLNAESGNGEVILTWSAASADNVSANKVYKVYKNNTEFTTTTSTSAVVTGLTNNTSYDFKVTTIDNAANESSGATISATPSRYSSNITVKRGNDTVNYVKNNDFLTVTCNFGETVNNARIRYNTYLGSSSSGALTLGTSRNSVNQIIENFTINSSSYDRIDLWCEVDSASVVTQKIIYVDNILPEIIWPSDFNITFAGQRTISITVTDNRNVSKVEFEIEGIKYNSTRSGNIFSTTLNTNLIPNGNNNLKVIATDEAGNINQANRTILISNQLSEVEKVQKAINDAKASRLVLNDLIKYFEANGIEVLEEILIDKNLADQKLNEAENSSDNTIKIEKAQEARTIYLANTNKLSIETMSSQISQLTNEEIEKGLQTGVITQENYELIKERALNSSLTRELNILKIGDRYIAQIIIRLNFDSNEDEFKVIEIIPKEFAKSATQIRSGTLFNIIEDDPIIEFIVPRGTTQISYTINNLSLEEANKLNDNNVLQKFIVPSVILEKEEDSKNIITNNFNLVLIIGIIILLLILIIVIGAIVYFKGKNNEFYEKDFNPIKKISEKLKNKKTPVSQKEKWKYKK